MSMIKTPRNPGDNVVAMPVKPVEYRDPAGDFPGIATAPAKVATAGGPDDPRMQEAMRLMQAFLAIEDAPGRAALITLAERMVSFDWARHAQQS